MISQIGLVLKGKFGNHYIYSTKNRIMPNIEYVARDYGDYCSLILPPVQFSKIENTLGLMAMKQVK